jgi:hypothetical protein
LRLLLRNPGEPAFCDQTFSPSHRTRISIGAASNPSLSARISKCRFLEQIGETLKRLPNAADIDFLFRIDQIREETVAKQKVSIYRVWLADCPPTLVARLRYKARKATEVVQL